MPSPARPGCMQSSDLAAPCADAPLIGEDPRAPVEVDEQLMCEACLAIVDYTMTELKKKVLPRLRPLGLGVAPLLFGRRLGSPSRPRLPMQRCPCARLSTGARWSSCAHSRFDNLICCRRAR